MHISSKARKIIIPVLCIVLLIGIFKVLGAILSPFNGDKFDPTIWKSPMTDDDLSNCMRGGMADDIVNKVIRVGMPRERVLELLGKAPDGHGNKEQYPLGYCSGIGADVDYLDLYYDAAGKLIDIDIHQY
ncbi:hypothetical protein [Massilia genomosp. 1]|uniref:PepSY domain-containing protein n=1 Tax=Massilia genomosp. 1 TaxID=2609280 RepID=A0ABX0MGG9_9BURK|nr:hypothetical protein [Massilia genomosp. 1]NHZ61421.1 hypothetical protein [Massilia genomosp. 1]